jgi:hypothetical protein
MNKIKDEIINRIDLTEAEEKELQLELVDELFEELVALEDDLDKYNMEWVFDYAHGRIEEVFEEEVKSTFVCLRDKKEGETIVKETNSMIHKIAKSIEKSTKSFDGAQTITTVGEIIGSFIIIMLSHEVTAYFVGHYSYLISTTIIVAIFAFFKIFMEKRYVSKFNRRRQKRIYKASLQKTRKSFIQMFLFYLRVKRFDTKCKGLTSEARHQKAILFIKENHPKLEFI